MTEPSASDDLQAPISRAKEDASVTEDTRIKTQASALENASVKMDASAGAILDVVDGVVSGWAWDATSPNRSVEIEIFAEGFFLGRGSANVRVDQQPESITGAHGFRIALEPPRQLAPPYEIWAQIAGATVPLQNSLSIGSLDQHERAVVPFAGEITGIAAGAIEGWIVRKSAPTVPLKVDLSIENEILSVADAGNSEPSAPSFGLGHGFRLKIPDFYLDGSIHVARIRVSGSSFEIKGSPYPFAFLPVTVISDRLERLEGLVAELRRDRDVQLQAVETLYTDVGKDLAQRLDAMMNLQRNCFEAELSSLRRTISNESGAQSVAAAAPATSRPIEMLLDERYVGYGWYLAETDEQGRPFRWMRAKSAVVLDYRSTSAALLVVEGFQILDPANLGFVKILVNGVPLSGTARFANGTWSYEATVPAHALHGSPFAVVGFEADFARRPGPADDRQLSISVRSVKLSPISASA